MSQGEKFFQVLLNLQAESANVYNGVRVWRPNRKTIYGGEFVAQAIVAAYQAVPKGRTLHSLQARFLKGGDHDKIVRYEVESLTEGETFAVKNVKAIQDNILRFQMSASFKKMEPDSLKHSISDANILEKYPSPNNLQSLDAMLQAAFDNAGPAEKKIVTDSLQWCQEFPCEIRPCNPMTYMKIAAAEKSEVDVWMRLRDSPEEVTPLQRQACLAYMSDMGILRPIFVKNPTFVSGMVTSLDHAIWFHDLQTQHYHPKNWVLFHFEALRASNALTFNTGQAYTENGEHIATIVQEGLFRPPREVNPNVAATSKL